jgi:hypothetical protein
LRVRKKAEELLKESGCSLTILCSDYPGTIQYFREISGVQVLGLDAGKRSLILKNLRRERFDTIHLFWTGETKYRHMKLLALRLGAGRILVDAGDGCVFPLTWKAILRFSLFRWRHPLPSDHYEFFPKSGEPDALPPAAGKGPQYFAGEKVLIVQSAEPPQVLRALDRLKERPLFHNPRYFLFCRNRPEILGSFSGHPMLTGIRVHSEARNSWGHLRSLRRERFAVVVLFLTGDPSYWKIKCLAFLLGARHKLVFNEDNNCFYFTWSSWFSLLSHRLKNRSRLPIQPRWHSQARTLSLVLIKLLVLPFRFAWLLAVWLRLRRSAMRASNYT